MRYDVVFGVVIETVFRAKSKNISLKRGPTAEDF